MAAASLTSIPSAILQRASSFASNIASPKPATTAPHPEHHSLSIIQEFRDQIKKGLPFSLEITALAGIVDALRHNNAIDDRKMLLETVLSFISKLPEGTLATKLQNATIELLYNDLPHPPSTYIGQKYAWREADGSNNNLSDPGLGKAGTPYSRSVQQTHPLPRSSLPDPGLVFDTLLKREKFVPHPAGLSSMMFSFAALVIHTVFRTSHENVNINETSSYVDLAPLYGNNQDSQNKIRKRNGTGELYPDVFTEDRLLLLPPATCVILVLFNRNHNYIAKKLLEINERGTYVDPATLSTDDPNAQTQLLAQEEDLFQTARLINCAWFGTAIFSDYFSAILGLVRQGSSWSLNPFGEIRNEDHSLFERGRGNVCSVEFNCLYRWHATTSVEDEAWVEAMFKQIFPGKEPDDLSISDFKATAKKLQAIQPDVTHWTFGNLQRQADGTFKDEDLAKIIQNSTDHAAGAFKARGTPEIMRLHEIMGIEQNRAWGVCSLNDFRKFLGLKPYSTFLEWNSNPEVASTAQKLYGDIDMLELYVGLQAEEAKPVVEGAGLCPAYTVSRAILSDAIALTRGDRFFTADYTSFNMTSWGFADCQREPTAPGYGSALGRLFLRTLPNHFAYDSTYTWFPLMTPQAMKKILTNLGDADKYQFKRSTVAQPQVAVSSYRDVFEVLRGTDRFGSAYESRAKHVVSGRGFFIASDDAVRGEREQRAMLNALTGAPGAVGKITDYFYQKTRELMVGESYTCVGGTTRNVDVVRDVLKYVPVYWACEVAGIQLKENKDSEEGEYTVDELYTILKDAYSYLFLDIEQSKLLALQVKVNKDLNKLLDQIKDSSSGSSGRLSIFGLLDSLSQMFKPRTDHDELVERFSRLGYDTNTLANSVLAVMVGSTVELSQALVHLVNFFLDDSKPTDVQTICTDVRFDSKSEEALQNLVLEALRLDPAFTGVFRESTRTQTAGAVKVAASQRIFVDIGEASLDDQAFPDPSAVDPTRSPRERYLVGDGSEKCLGQDLSTKIMAHVLRAVFGFHRTRRAPGQSGVLARFKSDAMLTSDYVYIGKDQKQTPWAMSMVLQFD